LTVYLDTSAAAKLLVEEPESEAVVAYLDSLQPGETTSSMLLETELRRLAVRLDLAQSAVSELLGRVALVEPPRSLFYEAGLLRGASLRSRDALHLATALRVEASAVMAYDRHLLDAARELGLDVVSPV